MDDQIISTDRANFLGLALVFQGGLLLVAILIAWLMGHSIWSQLNFSITQFSIGVIATLPMLLFLRLTYQSRSQHFARIRTILRDALGKPLSDCRWYDLGALALLAGFSEEFLFRGVLEPSFERWGVVPAVILCNVIFGACHAVTPAYAMYAALLGAYLSLTRWLIDEPNLMVPIICHSLYDFIAFFVVRNSYRRCDTRSLPVPNNPRPAKDHPDTPTYPPNH